MLKVELIIIFILKLINKLLINSSHKIEKKPIAV